MFGDTTSGNSHLNLIIGNSHCLHDTNRALHPVHSTLKVDSGLLRRKALDLTAIGCIVVALNGSLPPTSPDVSDS